MQLDEERLVWKLRPGINPPFAKQAEPAAADAAVKAAGDGVVLPETGSSPDLEAAAARIVAQAKAADSKKAALAKVSPASPAAAAPQGSPGAVPVVMPAMQPQAGRTLYISMKLQLSYLDSLLEFLQRKGVHIKRFSDVFDIKAPALVLLAPGELTPLGAVCYLPDEDKGRLWSFLKRELPEIS